MPAIRLQRFLAQAGVASRRHAEELIVAGKVRVNGRVVSQLGTRVDPDSDQVVVSGRRLCAEEHHYVLLHKPHGYVTTLSDPQGRPTVKLLLPRVHARLFPVGRLDYDSEGALLCTNDGELAHLLLHPRQAIDKVYRVKLRGEIADQALGRLRRGVRLAEGQTATAEIRRDGFTGKHTWLEVVLSEGRTRQVRRMVEAVGGQVLKLIRTHFAGLSLDGLPPGKARVLDEREVKQLRARCAGAAKRPPGSEITTGRRQPRTPPGRHRPPPHRTASPAPASASRAPARAGRPAGEGGGRTAPRPGRQAR